MDALELRAALVKLDPATTVTPIGSGGKPLLHHRIAFAMDPEMTTSESSLKVTTTTTTTTTQGESRKLLRDLPTTTQITKCNNIAEIRWRQPCFGVNMIYHTYPPHRGRKHHGKLYVKEMRHHHHHHTLHHRTTHAVSCYFWDGSIDKYNNNCYY